MSTSVSVVERLEQAELLKLNGQHEAAITILEELIMLDPENVSAFEELADNELSLDSCDRAAKAAERAIDIDKKSYTGHYILGYLECKQANWKDAADRFKKANSIKANNAEILRCLGWTLFNASERAAGIVTLERSLNLENDNVLTLCDLGIAYLQMRNPRKARQLFERTLEIDPENDRAEECVQALVQLETLLKEQK